MTKTLRDVAKALYEAECSLSCKVCVRCKEKEGNQHLSCVDCIEGGLKKLIDRTTPMNPAMIADEGFDVDVSSHLCCHHCKRPIVNVWSKREYKPKYCHYCGQAILWENDDGIR